MKTDVLDTIARTYDPSDPQQFDHQLAKLHAHCIGPWLIGTTVLELGCATGESTAHLAPSCGLLDVVEGSERNCEITRARVPAANVIHSLWGEYLPERSYTDVVLTLGLEHYPSPDKLLELACLWLMPEGRLHVIVPNGLSLHRLIGVEMGLQPDPLELTAADEAQGHLRNYTPSTIATAVTAAGLSIVNQQPVFLKTVPNVEMVGWTWERIVAVHQVAQQFPQNSAEIYVVAER